MNAPGIDGLHALFGRRPRLLVVDDQPANVQALYRVFAADHQVFMATSGEQALKVCAEREPDLVLLDVEMPGLDGHEVCRRLKAEARMRDIPVIFVTAHSDAEAEEHGLDAGAVDFISKPINPKVVRARARTHLTLKRQSDLLREWVYIDALTGVCNRRHFDERLAAEWSRAVRQDSALSLLLIDVDHFKLYNDHYGHQAGDACLQRIAQAIRGCLKRPTDVLARYGGEEFAGLLPDTDFGGTLGMAEQVVACVREAALPHERSATADVVTVSVGVCTRPTGYAGSAEALLREADAQLYLAKSRGRNRACGAELATGRALVKG